MRPLLRFLVASSLLAVAACSSTQDSPPSGIDALPTTITLASPAFSDGGDIPIEFTCDGADNVPPLTWAQEPPETRELVLLVTDPDAPGGGFTHWIAVGIPAGVQAAAGLPNGAYEGSNDFGDIGWAGPCPPAGDEAHRYVFTIIALDTVLGVASAASLAEVLAEVEGHGLARGVLTGRYQRATTS